MVDRQCGQLHVGDAIVGLATFEEQEEYKW